MIDFETKRLSRLISILTLLQTKRIITATQLAKRFVVSTRTIYRDMRTLENAGIPIAIYEGKGYSLVEGYRLPPVSFTENEANALITVEQLILTNADASLGKEYEQAVNKVKAILRNSARDKANLLASRIKIYPVTPNAPTSDYLSALQHALTNYTLVQMQYQSSAGEYTDRIVEPFALLSTQGNWLLVGWCHLRKAYRVFRLDRIVKLSVLQEKFPPHPLTLKEYFEKYSH